MYYLISILILITSVLIVLIVLIQNSKGGGLASNFSGSNQIMGVRRTADFLEKATWTLAIALLVLSLFASMSIPREEGDTNRSMIEDQINNQVDPASMPSAIPTQVPTETEPTEQPN